MVTDARSRAGDHGAGNETAGDGQVGEWIAYDKAGDLPKGTQFGS